jgi:hypothetical protein
VRQLVTPLLDWAELGGEDSAEQIAVLREAGAVS